MLRSLYAGVTGLQQHQKGMDVVGNNIANVNTVGYKSSRVVFQDLMSQTMSVSRAPADGVGGVNPKQFGLGSKIGSVDVNYTQGTLQPTGVTTDLAIQGDGFFVVKTANTEQTYYTRAGNFTFDEYGYLVNPSGMIVQGWLRNLDTNTLSVNGEATDIRIDQAYEVLAPRATTEVQIAGNLSTVADASILEYQPLLTTLDQTTNNDLDLDLNSIFGYSGGKMELFSGETVRIKADANTATKTINLYNYNNQNINIDNASDVIYITAGTASYTVNFTAATTLNDILTAVNGAITANMSLSITNGKLRLDASAVGTLSVDFSSNNSRLSQVLNSLDGSYQDNYFRTTDKVLVERELTYGEDLKSINDMITEIQSMVQNNISTGFTASYDESAGYITYSNTTGSSTITGFTIEKAFSGGAFQDTFDTFDTLSNDSAGLTNSSNLFRFASGDDGVFKLYNAAGDDLGVSSANSTINISSVVGGIPSDGVTSLAGSSTLDELMIQIENLILGSNDPQTDQLDGFVSLESGKIVVKGEKGVSNNIDNLLIKDTISGADNTVFNNYMRFSTIQEASGGQLVTSQTIYDSQGNEHVVNYQFDLQNESDNVWKLKVFPSNSDETVNIYDSLTNEIIGEELIVEFNPDGSFKQFANPNSNNKVEPVFTLEHTTGAYSVSDVKIQLGSEANFDGLTLTSRPSTITQIDQDGYKQGVLDSININNAGEIIGSYDNGQVLSVGIVGVANFSNNEGLMKMGESLFAATTNSGVGVVGQAGLGGRGVIESMTLENSNVDLAQEFVTMITTQRGYQANSRVITTSDEMLQELLSLKR